MENWTSSINSSLDYGNFTSWTNRSNLTECSYRARTNVPGSYSYYVGNYVFPLVFVVGFAGNVLNLLVLNSRGMKSKANYLLSSMAVADVGFFLIMFMINLSVYDSLATSETFLKFYYVSKMTLTTFANWFSSASIWLAVMVTVERLVAIRSPLQANSLLTQSRIMIIIFTTFGWTFLLQLYNFFWLKPGTRPNCLNLNETVYILRQLRVTDGYHLYTFVTFSKIATPIITVLLPLKFLIVLNTLLLYYLKTNRRNVARLSSSGTVNSTKSENKVTLMVLVIVLTFFIFNFPSAVVYGLFIFHPAPGNLAVYSLTANYLVTLNKALNFWLYCLASANFRKKLRRLCRKTMKKTDENQMYTMSTGGGFPSKTRSKLELNENKITKDTDSLL